MNRARFSGYQTTSAAGPSETTIKTVISTKGRVNLLGLFYCRYTRKRTLPVKGEASSPSKGLAVWG